MWRVLQDAWQNRAEKWRTGDWFLHDDSDAPSLCFVCAGIHGQKGRDCYTAPFRLTRSATCDIFLFFKTKAGTERKKIYNKITIQKQSQATLAEIKTQDL
jgi:hypothetical protein